MNPVAYGMEGSADFASWLASFILIDGKMRGLFSFLFGASMLLVIDRAEASGLPSASVHFRRMAWLLVFGLLHLYLVWFGDILASYALTGMIAWFFCGCSNKTLVRWAIALLLVQLLLFSGLSAAAFMLREAAAAPGAPAAVSEWKALESQFGVMTGQPLATDLAIYRGGYGGVFADRMQNDLLAPITAMFMFGWETLAFFLLGMAALRNGFLRGEWSVAAYRRTAAIGLGIGIPASALLAWLLARDGFSVPMVFAIAMAATVPLRPLMVAGTAALIILLSRRGGALVERIAAAGRAAFTNYLGTSILMTTLFYGYGTGLYGSLSRAELWIPVVAAWALMLWWSKPWLDRFRYGPLEWLWRSLSRWDVQPMRRARA
jgi:uncharacterized protein